MNDRPRFSLNYLSIKISLQRCHEFATKMFHFIKIANLKAGRLLICKVGQIQTHSSAVKSHHYCRKCYIKQTQIGSNDAEDELMVVIFLFRFPAVPQWPVPVWEQSLYSREVAMWRIQGDKEYHQEEKYVST